MPQPERQTGGPVFDDLDLSYVAIADEQQHLHGQPVGRGPMCVHRHELRGRTRRKITVDLDSDPRVPGTASPLRDLRNGGSAGAVEICRG